MLKQSLSQWMSRLEPVHRATTREEREAVYRFRYRVYFEEFGRQLGSPDHERRWVRDAEDEKDTTTILYTGTVDNITGTVRLRHWRAGEVPPEAFEELSMDRIPDIDRRNVAEIERPRTRAKRAVDRLRHTRLSWLFGPLRHEMLRDLEAEIEWRTLEGGETLYRQGDAADAAWFVASGRLRLVLEYPEGGERVVSEVGPGETVGEMALLDGGRRSATVYALRDSDLGRISRAGFERLIEKYPRAMVEISRIFADRLRSHRTAAARPSPGAATIALVPARPGVPVERLARDLEQALADRHGPVTLVTSGRVEEALGRAGSAQGSDDGVGDARLVQWLNERESGSRFVVYLADPGWSSWTERCVRQADRLLIVADAGADPAPGEIEERLGSRFERTRAPHRTLVLLQRGEPAGTSRWLVPREVDLHVHLRPGRNADAARLARIRQRFELEADPRLGTELCGWKALWNRLKPPAARLRTPGIFSLLQRATEVASVAARNRTKALADLYLELSLDEWGLLEFDALDAIAARGYEAAVERLADWRAGRAPAAPPAFVPAAA